MEYYYAACEIIEKISLIISEEININVSLVPTGWECIVDGGYSFEINDVDIPSNLIYVPNPKYSNDTNGFYRVNRIRLSKIILDDAKNGFPLSNEIFKGVIKNPKTWAYYDK